MFSPIGVTVAYVLFLNGVRFRGACVMRPPPFADGPVPGAHYAPNASTLTATWNITQACDTFQQGQQVCCSEGQYHAMATNFIVLQATLAGCDACSIAMKRMWCSFTCSPNQSDFVSIRSYVPDSGPDPRVQSVYLNITSSFAERFWMSCQNAGFRGTESFKNMFLNGVSGLLTLMASKTPSTEPPTSHLVHSIPIDYHPHSKALNVTLAEDQYSCSKSVPPPQYPMPRAMVGLVSLEAFTLIMYFIILALSLLLGVRNMYAGSLKGRLSHWLSEM